MADPRSAFPRQDPPPESVSRPAAGVPKRRSGHGKFGQYLRGSLDRMAGPTGFEPAISSVTGWHVWPLHHGPAGVTRWPRIAQGLGRLRQAAWTSAPPPGGLRRACTAPRRANAAAPEPMSATATSGWLTAEVTPAAARETSAAARTAARRIPALWLHPALRRSPVSTTRCAAPTTSSPNEKAPTARASASAPMASGGRTLSSHVGTECREARARRRPRAATGRRPHGGSCVPSGARAASGAGEGGGSTPRRRRARRP